MYITSKSFPPYGFIPEKHAFGKWDPDSKFTFAGNRNPHLAWGGEPEGTKSFAILCYDPEVPTSAEDVNQEGRTVPLDLPRADFFHWVLVDLPVSCNEIAEGSHCDGFTNQGKAGGPSPSGGQQGINDYTNWFAGNPDMAGNYHGYDGPFPPWNDERVHAYRFVVYALDVETLGLEGPFNGHEARSAMADHILDSAEIVGLYAIYPDAAR